MDTLAPQKEFKPLVRRAKKKQRKRLIWAVILVVLLAGGYFWNRNRLAHKKDPLKDLQTAPVTRTTLLETVSASGTVSAQTGQQVSIGSQVTGIIKRLYADVGSYVKAGQLIAELDLPDTQAQLRQSQAALVAAQEKLQQFISGVDMLKSQTTDAVRTADDSLKSAQAKLLSAIAAARMSPRQTTSDIRKAQAALNTALASQKQTLANHNLEIATAKSTIVQDKSSAQTAEMNLKRSDQLFKQGYVAAGDVDTAQTAADVAEAQLDAAQQNLSLTQAKVVADDDTAQQQVDQARATLNAAQSEAYNDQMRQQDVRDARASVRLAEANLNAAKAGMAQNLLRTQDIQQAQAAVDQAKEQVKYWQDEVDKDYIRTPISGTVLQLASQQGETLAAGLSAPTLIIVANLDRLQVDAFVDETDIGKVRLGQVATATVDAFPDVKFTGKVQKIASGSTLEQNVITYDTTISIQDPKHLLKPGMTASVTITIGSHVNVLAVPNEAIKPQETGTGSFVWLQRHGHGTPIEQDVKTGATDGTNTEIKSGVHDGDAVVLAGWPPQFGFAGVRMTPFGLRPADQGKGGGKGGGKKGG